MKNPSSVSREPEFGDADVTAMEEIQDNKPVFDTTEQQLGDIYAKALLGFGSKSGNVDQLVDELAGVVGAVNELPKFKAALESPRIANSEKAAMIDKAFGGKVSKDLVNLLKILGNKDRFDCLDALLGCAQRIRDEMTGRVEATVTTAESIDDGVKDKIAQQLAQSLGKQVHMTALVDPAIIGGMVVRVGDTVYDDSVVSQLAQVRSQTLKRTTDAMRSSVDKFSQTE